MGDGWRAVRAQHVACSLALAISACGGGSGGQAGSSPPVSVAPTPTPTPTPVPTPSPTPTPTPTPSTARFLQARPGESLDGLLACANGSAQTDARGHVTGLASLNGVKADNFVSMLFRDLDSYAFDINGFGGSAFGPASKSATPVVAYDQFLDPVQGELYQWRQGSGFGSPTWSTPGFLNSNNGLCLFAIGLRNDSLPADAVVTYGGRVDGIGRVSGQTLRLFGNSTDFGSRIAVVLDTRTRAVTIELRMVGRGNAFEDFGAQAPTSITVATASATIANQPLGNFGATLTGTSGYTGALLGHLVGPSSSNDLGGGGAGMVMTFSLTNAQGDVLFGVVAAERN